MVRKADDITAELLDCSSKNVAEATVIEAHLALLESQRRRVTELVSASDAALDTLRVRVGVILCCVGLCGR